MSKQTKSQWDFGELFPTETTRRVLTVTELTTQVKRLLEKSIGLVWVTGEVTKLRLQSSSHVYFTLKDANAQLNCVLFRGESVENRDLLQDGQKLVVQGDLTVYEPRGQYQLVVRAVELQGVGALQLAFERLKRKLQAEGLFAPERKRPLPRFPQRIGLVTSPTGAAIRDVLHVIERRNPALEIVLASCRVQGDGAAIEIASAIGLLNEFHSSRLATGDSRSAIDLILITRGGGSLEDLWAFNEEIVARAIFHSALPVVSGVGHEIDFTISDFVADLRAATPSAAAEIITEGVFSSCQFISDVSSRLRQLVLGRLTDKEAAVERVRQRLARLHPRRRLQDLLQLLDDLQSSLVRCVKQDVRRRNLACRTLSDRLTRVRPALILKQQREVLRGHEQRLREQAHHRLETWSDRLRTLEARLRLLGPEQVLARGYSITSDAETGKVLRDEDQVTSG